MEHCVPVTCVLMSILDLGHPLRGGSNMGHRCTAKPGLCSAFIHLRKRKNVARMGVKQRKLTHTNIQIRAHLYAYKQRLPQNQMIETCNIKHTG